MPSPVFKIPLPKNRPLRFLAVIFWVGFGLVFLPFIIGAALGRLAWTRIRSGTLRNAVLVLVTVPTLFVGTVWAAAFLLPGAYGLPRQTPTPSPNSLASVPAESSPSPVAQTETTSSPVPTDAPSVQPQGIGQRTKSSGCQMAGALPDKACTPGAVFAAATKDQVCVSGYSSSVRDVPESEKNAVYAEYGIASHAAGQYEVDHYVSLELGGSNDIANLWPEPASPTPGFHEKDTVENWLHSQVCSGSVTLAQAQEEIASDWTALYSRASGSTAALATATPVPVPVATAAYDPSSPPVKKSDSGNLCHAKGTTYYDRTTRFTPYQTIQECLDSGGGLPKN